MTNTMSEDRLRNVRAWAAARPDMSGSEIIVGAIDELLHLRGEVAGVQAAHAEDYADDRQEITQLRGNLSLANAEVQKLHGCWSEALANVTARNQEIEALQDRLETQKGVIANHVEGEREIERAQRIMRRAISWLQIKEAAFATAKGPAIIEEMQRFCVGGSSEPGVVGCKSCERLQADLDWIARMGVSIKTLSTGDRAVVDEMQGAPRGADSVEAAVCPTCARNGGVRPCHDKWHSQRTFE